MITGIKKIAVLRALQLGDLLCAVPAFRALRNAYPDAEIVLLGLPWAKSFTQRFSKYFDRFIHFPGYPGLPEQNFSEEAWQEFVQEMKEENFDLILQMQGNGTIVNDMLQALPAAYLAGFHNSESYMDSELFIEYPDHTSEVNRHLLLMQHLGIEVTDDEMEFPIMDTDLTECKELPLTISPGNYVCIHAGSRGQWRQWPPRHFALMADYCNKKGLTAILTGTKDEAEITREVCKYLEQPAVDLTGKTSLGCLAVLLKDARLLISNCTGVAHLAAAVKTPGLIISMDGEPERWGHPIHTVIDWTKKQSLKTVLESTDEMIAAY